MKKIFFLKKGVVVVGLFSLLLPSLVYALTKEDVTQHSYIVVFKDSASSSETESEALSRKYGVGVEMRYDHIFKGAVIKTSKPIATKISKEERVLFLSEDREVSILNKGGAVVTQPQQIIPNGLKRIGGVVTNKGAGIGVAVIDTGVDLKHPDLVSNLAPVSKTCVTGTRTAQDDNGHGTHVAGTIAGANNSIGVVGVASEAKIVPVKVLNKNGSGTWSSIICGIDWVTANAQTYNIKVANMSLGGYGVSDNNCGLTNNDALHQAICRSTAKGVTYVVAAGNEGSNTSSSVPAGYDDTVITVSALADSDGFSGGFGSSTFYGADDTFASFSNYGSEVDIAAPGVNIYSTWKGGSYASISGTSMATPHVSGAVALYRKLYPNSSLQEVKQGIILLGEVLGSGHVDPSHLHPEPVLIINSL
jgi:subtilisin family serine protease